VKPLILEVLGGRLKIPTDIFMTWAMHCAKKQPAVINKCALLKEQKSQTLHYLLMKF
jgi:hypothetical protein